jgi:hypothetical protein
VTTFIALLIKPFAALIFFGALLCVRFAVIRWWPESRLKRYLLTRLY